MHVNEGFYLANMTPHAIHLHGEDGTQVAVIQPSGQLARIGMVTELVAVEAEMNPKGGIPIYRPTMGKPVLVGEDGQEYPFPPQEDGISYIVSSMFREAMPEREDLYSPGIAIRDSEGRITGTIGLFCT